MLKNNPYQVFLNFFKVMIIDKINEYLIETLKANPNNIHFEASLFSGYGSTKYSKVALDLPFSKFGVTLPVLYESLNFNETDEFDDAVFNTIYIVQELYALFINKMLPQNSN
jgi:hypothetical protein